MSFLQKSVRDDGGHDASMVQPESSHVHYNYMEILFPYQFECNDHGTHSVSPGGGKMQGSAPVFISVVDHLCDL